MFSSENGKWVKNGFFSIENINAPVTGIINNMSFISTGLGA